MGVPSPVPPSCPVDGSVIVVLADDPDRPLQPLRVFQATIPPAFSAVAEARNRLVVYALQPEDNKSIEETTAQQAGRTRIATAKAAVPAKTEPMSEADRIRERLFLESLRTRKSPSPPKRGQ